MQELDIENPMTLDECAHCVQQLNIELQRQTDAYRHFKQIAARIETVVKGGKIAERMPFVTFTYPNNNKPGEYKLDLDTLSPCALSTLAPLYDSLVDAVATDLLMAWTQLIEVVKIAEPQVKDAQYSIGVDHAG